MFKHKNDVYCASPLTDKKAKGMQYSNSRATLIDHFFILNTSTNFDLID